MADSTESRVVYVGENPTEVGEGHWYARPLFRFQPVTKLPIQYDATSQGRSMPGLVITFERALGFYIGLYP